MTAFISRAYGSKEWEVIIKTDCKEHYEQAELFARMLIDHGKTHPMTNADRIRAMSDEELSAIILCTKQFDMNATCDRMTCHQCALNWLKQPVKDGDSE